MTDSFEIVRYLAVGGLVTVADMIVYNTLTGGARRVPRVPANILSVTVGMILGFTLHFALVFQPREALIAERLTRYVLVVGVSVYGVQNLVIYTLAELWRGPVRVAQTVAHAADQTARFSDDFIDRILGKVAAALAGVIWNFVFFKCFVYA